MRRAACGFGAAVLSSCVSPSLQLSYFLGEARARACPAGLQSPDLAGCQAAAIGLGLPFASSYSTEYYPRGCYQFLGEGATANKVFFNTHGTGAAHADAAPVCQTANFVSEAGSPSCAAGSRSPEAGSPGCAAGSRGPEDAGRDARLVCPDSGPPASAPTPPPMPSGPLGDIRVKGLRYSSAVASKGATQLQRFRDTLYETGEGISGVNPSSAKTTSGGALVFESNARRIILSFVYDSADGAINHNSSFAVMQDGVLCAELYVPKSEPSYQMTILSQSPGQYVRYEVVLPSLSNPLFAGVVEGELRALDLPDRGVYVALGDSITHGVGQASKAYQSYPWQVASAHNVELFNLAVSGGKVSNQIAQQLVDWPHIDFLTSLVGYNDWYYAGKTVETYIADYRELLATVREAHPTTPVFVLNCLYITSCESPRNPIPLEDFRVALRAMVTDLQGQGDVGIYLVPSDTWMDAGDLADVVHLNPDGAAKLASILSEFISSRLGKQTKSAQ